ncbi:MAG: AAA family ATPase, partial [Cetobacterium sp.]|uniref:AAA family ATPase n=2 Tax=Cetobacterium sp. TaxID=2071632 RepID=UPI003EE55544
NITINNLEEFKEVLENEKKAILKNDDLQTKFQKIEVLLTNQESKRLREILDKNRDFLLELENIENFQKKIWLTYFFHLTNELNLLKEIYKKNQQSISEIIKKASQEKTEWEKVIELYNQRFKMPFKIKIANKSNSLLGIQEPQIEFEYNGYIIPEDRLKKDILSTGEKRALYLLEVLYKIELLKLERHKKIIILDDIADSFDYKNKYAIIEYLNDLIKEQDQFKLIILTHNFDFYRTIATRLDLKKNSFMTLKNEEKIILEQGQYFENIFKIWKKDVLSNQKITLVVIPFMRNLIEYSRGNKDKDYVFLTNLLHYNKNETEKITISELREVYNNGWFQNKNTITTSDTTVIGALLLESDTIVQDKNENINLDNKIVLSMSIRYLSEKYMLEEILKYKPDYKSAGYNQTKDLLNNYKEINKNYLEVFEAVNLMTAENIHINSFMYEPLIDMSSNHLKELYIKVKNIKQNLEK